MFQGFTGSLDFLCSLQMPPRSRRATRRLKLKRYRGGDPQLPAWVLPLLNEAVRIQQLARVLDEERHTFLIVGSMAILFYIEATFRSAQSPEERRRVLEILDSMQPPRDLDFKYAETGDSPFMSAVKKRNGVTGGGLLGLSGLSGLGGLKIQTSFNYNITTCPEYVDLGPFRACAPIGTDVTFKKRRGETSIFDSVDFTELSPRRRGTNLYGTAEHLFGGEAQVMGFEELQQLYMKYDRGVANAVKRHALEALGSLRK